MDCTIVSLYPQTLEEKKPGLIPNVFIIKGPKKPGDFEVTHITDAKWQTDPVHGRQSIFVPELAATLAHSIIHDFLTSKIGTEEGKGPGIFYVEGVYTKEEISKKFEKELREAKAKQDLWFFDQILVADTDWARRPSHLVITKDAKIAAEWLGQEREWMFTIDRVTQKGTKVCLGCASDIPLAAIVCKDCKTIQDVEKYKGLKVAQ